MRIALFAPLLALMIACGGESDAEPAPDATSEAFFASLLEDIEESCDDSYPDVCIPSPPPDLDCGQIDERRFEVVGDDPHGFDADFDGVGCELD